MSDKLIPKLCNYFQIGVHEGSQRISIGIQYRFEEQIITIETALIDAVFLPEIIEKLKLVYEKNFKDKCNQIFKEGE